MQMHKFKGMKSILIHPKARTLKEELRRQGVVRVSKHSTSRGGPKKEKKDAQLPPSARLACMKDDDRVAIENLSKDMMA